jgi:hypothetical protein
MNIATKKDLLVIELIKYEGTLYSPKDRISVSQILYTPNDILFKAKVETKSLLNMITPLE